MSEKSRKIDGVKKILFQYSPHKVGLALEAIRNGMKVATASKNFNVPRTTLRHKLSGNAPETSGHVGPQAVLGMEIENELVAWIKASSRAGFPINKEGLLDSVKKIVIKGNLKTPFINNRPSRSWFDGFMARHPDLSQKHAEYINKARALITEQRIRNWFKEVTELIGEENMNVLEDPSRVWNCDETSFFLAPKGGLVLAEKGQHVYDTSKNSDKENVTTLFTVNAFGDYAPPLTVYKYKRMSSEVVQNAPAGWGIGKTDKGWMTGEAFYEYVGNVFIPYLKDKGTTLPIVLFLDGHKSHLTMHLSTLCRENGIIVVALVPNTTHMMQPLDVAVFFPLKQNWRKFVKKWRIENDGKEITKFNLPAALHGLLVNDESFSSNVKAGFRTCGLYPFSPDLVNYKRIVKTHTHYTHTSETVQVVSQATVCESSYLDYLENKIDEKLLEDFNITFVSGNEWEGKREAAMLYETWLAFKNDTNVKTFVSNQSEVCEVLSTPPLPLDPCNENEAPGSCTSPSILDDKCYEEDILRQTDEEVTVKRNQTENVKENIFRPSNIITDIANASMNTPDKKSNIVRECVLWPEKVMPKNKKTSKYIPSVLTSDKWMQIMQEPKKSKIKKTNSDTLCTEATSSKMGQNKELKTRKRKRLNVSSASTTSEEDIREIALDTDTDDDWAPEPALTAFDELERRPVVGDYVLVEFKQQKNTIYYVGKILDSEDKQKNFEISYLRKRGNRFGQRFTLPLEPDLNLVSIADIKMILPPPIFAGATQRQKSSVSFEIDLSNFDVR